MMYPLDICLCLCWLRINVHINAICSLSLLLILLDSEEDITDVAKAVNNDRILPPCD